MALKAYRHLTNGEVKIVASGSAEETALLADVVHGTSYPQLTSAGHSQEIAAAQGTALWTDVTSELGAGGGGSSNVSVVDCGVIQVEDVVAAGALELVARAEGRFISAVRFGIDEYHPPSDGSALWIITQNTAGYSGFGTISQSEFRDTMGLAGTGTGGAIGVIDIEGMRFDPGPLVAGSGFLGLGGQEFIAPGTWQAGHAYCIFDTIVDGAGHFHEVLVNGVSGGSEPAWNIAGGTTDDGSVQWNDRGLSPTGSVHVYAEVVETGNPSPPYPAAIEYVQQPTDAAAEAPIAPAVTVRILDQHGALYSDDVITVFLRIVGAGSLSGASVATVDGVATFDALTITEPDTDYVLRAVLYPSIGIAMVDSDPFDIS